MTRYPQSIPDGLIRPQKRDYSNWLLRIISFILLILAVVILTPQLVTRLVDDPLYPYAVLTSPRGEYYVLLLVPTFLTVQETHEQSHRIAAKLLNLDPTYRRWWPFNGAGYVLIQETWISRREANLMTAAPLLTIQLPSLLVLFTTSGILGAIAEIAFVMNASMIAKDVSDIGFNLRLPKGTQFWVSDLGEEPVEYFAVPQSW